MAYDERLARKLRDRIGDRPDVTEKQMFGGIAFLIRGNMAVGVHGDELIVRVGKEAHGEALSRAGARTFDLTTRPMQGWVVVGADGVAAARDLRRWIDDGVSFAESLPPK